MAKEKRNIPIVDSPYAGYDPIRGQLATILVGKPVPVKWGIDHANGPGDTVNAIFRKGKMIISCRKLHTRAIGYK